MRRKYFGTTSEGIPVHIFHLESSSGVTVRVMEYGAGVVSIETPDRNGRPGPIVVGYDELASYLEPRPLATHATKNPFEHEPLETPPPISGTLGRYAGKIGAVSFCPPGPRRAGSRRARPHPSRRRSEGLHHAVWWGEALGEGVRFHYCSPAGEEGNPGTLECSVEYRLNRSGNLRVEFHATTNASTLVDLASQIYFNLSDGGASSLSDHKLTIAADEIVELDSGGVPTGHFVNVEGSTLDFTAGKRIAGQTGNSARIPDVNDHYYVLRQSAKPLHLAAWVRDPKSGRSLEISTSQPGLHFETGSRLPHRAGQRLFGLCLSPQNLPAAPNHRHFPSSQLAPGSAYHQTTVFCFRCER